MNTTDKPGRIGGWDWEHARPHAIAVYNNDYAPSGPRIGKGIRPWVTAGPKVFETFPTHAEAIDYAFAQIPEQDPTPQDRESVTAGWQPNTAHYDAWAEKEELTR